MKDRDQMKEYFAFLKLKRRGFDENGCSLNEKINEKIIYIWYPRDNVWVLQVQDE